MAIGGLFLMACAAWSQAGEPSGRDRTLVLRGGRVFDPVALALHEPCDLWLRGERVVGERPLGGEVPDGALVLEVAGSTLLPGLFDLHAHVAVPGGSMSSFVLLPAEDNLRSQLYCGVTHVVDLHGDERTIFALRDRSRVETELARLYSAGAAFTAPGGHGTQFGIAANVVTGPDDVAKRFAQLLPRKPDVIKAILEHGDWGPVPKLPTLDDATFGAIARHAREAKLPLFAHVWSLDEALTATRGGATALVHGVFLGDATPELAEAMKQRSVAYVPTLAVVAAARRCAQGKTPYRRKVTFGSLHPDVASSVTSDGAATWATGDALGDERRWFANLRTLAEAGVELGTGTDAGNPLTPHGPALLAEIALYVEAGLAPSVALRAATLGSARILGVERDFGTLEPGKVADVVVVRGDPTTSIETIWNVTDVIKAGAPVERVRLAKRNADLAQAPATKRAGTDVLARIDGFDDGDATTDWGGSWVVTTDAVTPQGKSTGTIETRDGVLRVRGTLNQGFPHGCWAGAHVDFDAQRKTWIDGSDFDGLRLRVRGTNRYFAITLNRAAVKDFNVFASELDVEPEWRVVSIPFSEFHQIGFGATVPWAADDFTGIDVTARTRWGSADYGEFELEIDWIELYRDA